MKTGPARLYDRDVTRRLLLPRKGALPRALLPCIYIFTLSSIVIIINRDLRGGENADRPSPGYPGDYVPLGGESASRNLYIHPIA